jgi:hypothetical protein
VENLVGYAKRDLIIPQAPFTDMAAANAPARQWCAEVNGVAHSEICAEMAGPLTQFRSAMVTVSRSFTSAPWESAFHDELHDAWTETVSPALEAIEASVRDNRSLLTLAAGAAGEAKATLPGLLLMAAGLHSHTDAATAAGGALSASLPLLRDRRTEARNIRMKPFYFLYTVNHSLS